MQRSCSLTHFSIAIVGVIVTPRQSYYTGGGQFFIALTMAIYCTGRPSSRGTKDWNWYLRYLEYYCGWQPKLLWVHNPLTVEIFQLQCIVISSSAFFHLFILQRRKYSSANHLTSTCTFWTMNPKLYAPRWREIIRRPKKWSNDFIITTPVLITAGIIYYHRRSMTSCIICTSYHGDKTDGDCCLVAPRMVQWHSMHH